MKQAFSLFVVLMFMLSGLSVAFAQDTTNGTTTVQANASVVSASTETTANATASDDKNEVENETNDNSEKEDDRSFSVRSREHGAQKHLAGHRQRPPKTQRSEKDVMPAYLQGDTRGSAVNRGNRILVGDKRSHHQSDFQRKNRIPQFQPVILFSGEAKAAF